MLPTPKRKVSKRPVFTGVPQAAPPQILKPTPKYHQRPPAATPASQIQPRACRKDLAAGTTGRKGRKEQATGTTGSKEGAAGTGHRKHHKAGKDGTAVHSQEKEGHSMSTGSTVVHTRHSRSTGSTAVHAQEKEGHTRSTSTGSHTLRSLCRKQAQGIRKRSRKEKKK